MLWLRYLLACELGLYVAWPEVLDEDGLFLHLLESIRLSKGPGSSCTDILDKLYEAFIAVESE